MGSEDHRGDSPMDRGACSGVRAVVHLHSDALLCGGLPLCRPDSLEDLARWRDAIIRTHRHMLLGISAAPGAAGYPRDGDGSPVAPSVAISRLEALLTAGFDQMRTNGELAVDADPARLATGLTAALQGGSLLAQTTRDLAGLEAALDMALSCVRSHSAR